MATLKELQKIKQDNLHLVGKRFRKKNGSATIHKAVDVLIRPHDGEVIKYSNLIDEFNPELKNFVYVIFSMGMYAARIEINDFYKDYEVI